MAFTPIPNHILDGMPSMKPSVCKVVMFVCRQTYGYDDGTGSNTRKEWDQISISQFVKGTGLSNRSILDAISEAVDGGWIEQNQEQKPFIYRIPPVKKVHNHGEKSSQCSDLDGEKSSLDGEKSSPSGEPNGEKSSPKVGEKSSHTKESINKDLDQSRATEPEPEGKVIDDDSDDSDDLMPGQHIRSLIEGKGFMYLDQDFATRATKLEEQYSHPELVQALEQTHKYHLKKIGDGERGITAPLAYMAQVLAGNITGDDEVKPSRARELAQRIQTGKPRTANDYHRNGRRQDGIGYVPGTAYAFARDYEGPPA